MALGVPPDVREIVMRACARNDVLDACRRRDLGTVIAVLGTHGVAQGQLATLTGISQGRLSEYKTHKRTPRASSIFQAFADGVGMPSAAREALGLAPDRSPAGSGGRLPDKPALCAAHRLKLHKHQRHQRQPVSRQAAPRKQAVAKSTPLSGHRSSVLPVPPPAGTRPLHFKGYLATVSLYPDRIEIDRTFRGRMNGNRSTSVQWPQQLVSVDFLEPTRLVNGHIHFATAADPRGLTATGSGNRMAAAARNPHAIMFTWRQRATYEQLRGLLMANARH